MKKRVLLILSEILGHKTFSKKIIECLDRIKNIESQVVYFNVSDYSKYRTWGRCNLWKSKFESSYAIRNKLNNVDTCNFDLIFILGYEFIYGLKNIVPLNKTILCTDTTDIQSHILVCINDKSTFANAKRILKDSIGRLIYSVVIQKIAAFAPMSDWCAQSLMSDYGVPKNKITILYGGLDTDIWAPEKCSIQNNVPNILLVTNDFNGKGGHLLLEAYNHFLREKCTFTIMSNDPSLSEVKFPKGVVLKKGITHDKPDELIKIYQSSDIFVLPTHNDKFPNVLKEAASVGLPLIATDLAGIKEIVRDGYNGILLNHSSRAIDWAEAISTLIDNPSLRQQFGKNSRKLACELFSMVAMEKQLMQLFNSVLLTSSPHT